MSSYIKKEGTTSMLLEAVDDILLPNSTRYLDIVDKIEANHLTAAEEAVSDLTLRAESVAFIRHECQRLRSFMSAAEVSFNELSIHLLLLHGVIDFLLDYR
jgi:aspartate kinase